MKWAKLLAILALLFAPGLAFAGDGDLHWQTLHTPDADIHFPEQYRHVAERVADTLHDARTALAPLFNERDRPKLQISLDDFIDTANGWATPVPYDHVHLLAYPPDVASDLADHGDWLRALLFHEYSHILHMGDVSGIPALGNALFGRRFMPNAALPRFFLEGLATWVETRQTGHETAVAGVGGRVDSAQFSAMLRAAVRDGTLPYDLSELAGGVLRWPFGTAWYLYGSVLIDDLDRRFGAQKIREFMGEYGKQVLVFGVQGLARQVFGASLSRLWRDAREQVQRQVWAEWRATTGLELAEGATESLDKAELQGDGRRLTRDGHWRGRLGIDGQGRALVAHTPFDGPSRIERIDLNNGQIEALHRCAYDCDEPMVTKDGRWLLLVAARNRQRVYLYRELVAVPLQGSIDHESAADFGEISLTDGLRLRSMALSPDGLRLYGVAVRGARTALVAVNLAQALQKGQAGQPLHEGEWTWLTGPAALGTVLDSPVELDGALWWTYGRGGERRLVRAQLNVASEPRLGPTQEVMATIALGDPLLPAHAPGGAARWVGDLHTFARDGKPMLGALVQQGRRRDAAELDPQHPERGWQLHTRTLTGLSSAAFSATATATVREQGHGLDVWRAPDRSNLVAHHGADHGADPREPLVEPPPAYAPERERSRWLVSGYNPLPTLAPRAWVPILVSTGDGSDWRYGGTWIGAQVAGADAAGWAELALLGQMRNNNTDRVAVANLSVRRWEPLWSLSLAYDEPWTRFRRGFWWYGTPERRIGARLGFDWTLPHLRKAWQFSAGVRWVQTWLVEQRYDLAVETEPAGLVPREPVTGGEVLADGALTWSTAEAYATSIRSERLHSLTLRGTLADSMTTGLQRMVVGADTAHAWPLGRRRVLAMQAHLTMAPLPGQTAPLYAIAGIHPLQALAVLGLGGPTDWTVRGAPLQTGLTGNAMVWGGAQFAFPIHDLGRTLDLLPAYAGRLTGQLFVDAAAVGESPWASVQAKGTTPGWLASLGAEVALGVQVGYAIDAVVRVGSAWLPGLQSWGSWLSLGL